MSETVAVYGGGFNPPHVGHGMVIQWILTTGLADYVLLVPAADHPFGKKMAPFETRLDYCRAFAQDLGNSLVYVSVIERRLPAPNYTINLCRALREEQLSGDRIRFVMGADNLAKRAEWHGFDELMAEFDPIFVNRSGVMLPEDVEIMSPVFPDISSTEVRRRLVEGLPVDHLLTKSVRRLVRPA